MKAEIWWHSECPACGIDFDVEEEDEPVWEGRMISCPWRDEVCPPFRADAGNTTGYVDMGTEVYLVTFEPGIKVERP